MPIKNLDKIKTTAQRSEIVKALEELMGLPQLTQLTEDEVEIASNERYSPYSSATSGMRCEAWHTDSLYLTRHGLVEKKEYQKGLCSAENLGVKKIRPNEFKRIIDTYELSLKDIKKIRVKLGA